MLNIPPSTLRRYSATLAAYLSPQVTGKKRSYNDDDVLVLKRIKELARKFPLEQIGPRLQVVDNPRHAVETSLSLVPSLKAELMRLDTDRQALTSQVEDLRAMFAADHARLERLSAWAALPWWKRLFTPPPG